MRECREEHYWSRFARSYDRDGEYVVGKPILQAVREKLLNEQSIGSAIEFGCGTGYFTRAIARNATHVVVTDLSDEMLEVVRTELANVENVSIQRADCSKTSFPPNSFDSVFMLNLIHVIDHPSQCLRESHRILRNGGSLVVVDFTGYGMRFIEKAKLVIRYLQAWGLPPARGKNNLSSDELVDLVEGVGFIANDVQLLQYGANALYLRAGKKQTGHPSMSSITTGELAHCAAALDGKTEPSWHFCRLGGNQ